ncbi:MAG: sigma-70 family RNA polymerase sigma factor [Planctomycetaceae bacterium]
MKAGVRAYQSTLQQGVRDQLIMDNLTKVRQILARMLTTLPDFVDRENLEAAGVLGLVEAAQSFDPNRGTDFGAFAYKRIRGAILDELRSNCPLPQHILVRWAAIRRFMETHPTEFTSERIAAGCNLSVEDVELCLEAIKLTRPEEWQDEFGLSRTSGVLSEMETAEAIERLSAAIEQLDSRRRAIVIMYYRDKLNLKEIGEVLSLHESRISRLLSQAERQLRILMQDCI